MNDLQKERNLMLHVASVSPLHFSPPSTKAMAELLSAIIPTLLKKACDSILAELTFMRGIDGRRKRLCGLLSAINDVISNAEEQAPEKPSVKDWITRLKSAALDADNIIDELHYEVLRRKALCRGHDVNSGVRGFFSINYNPLLFKYKVGKKLQEVVERIDDLVNQMNRFGFSRDRPAPMVGSRQTHSYVNEDEVVGRKGDGEEIVHMLLSSESEKFSVLAVVGIGGMGKTTLAQLVFSDVRVRAQFQVCVWVCVSDPFIVADVVKKIIDSAIGRDCGLKTDNMELLQQHLRNELGGKRYFLVLDDVWNQEVEKWDALRTLLCCGGMGSVVLVTTRQRKVASIMGVHCLQHLSPEDAWTLFKRRAFSLGVVESPDLVEVGKGIVKKCCGVPLAVKSISSLMSRKHEVREWLAILESKTWDVFHEDNQIMPALRLSYYHLPSRMKQCFIFCAVFPKDYEINKKDLIHLWIANGFILSEGGLDLETIGDHVFSELVWRSFFQDVKHARSLERSHYRYGYPFTNEIGYHNSFLNGNGYCGVTTCKIHDLLHDLAQIIGHGEYFSLQKLTEISELPENVLHLHCSVDFPWRKIKVVMQHNRHIRSIFGTYVDDISRQDLYFLSSSLRVFGTCVYEISLPAFMKHLRYVDLSRSNMITLPSSICTFYNLQVLVLNECYFLELLPERMKYMISLRHLYLDDCLSLAGMPADIGQLSHLRTLTKYVVGNDLGHGIKELKDLDLGGKLQIYDLIKVTNQSDAKEANLKSKHNLEQLTLCWGTMEGTYQQEFLTEDSRLYPAEEILDALKPHICLQVLTIDGYMGARFPRWGTDNSTLHRLVELTLSECVKCTNIPSVWQLPYLVVLKLKGLQKLTNLCNSQCIDDIGCYQSAQMFPKLKILSLERMDLLDRWKENDGTEVSSVVFPFLDTMIIIACPKLTTFPKVPVLKYLNLRGKRAQLDLAAGLTTLSSLSLRCLMSPKMLNDPSVSKQNNDVKPNILVNNLVPWGSLTNLSLGGFNGLTPHDKEHMRDHVTYIKNLDLNCCDLFIQPNTLQSPLCLWELFVSLECLTIFNCDSLTFWPSEELQSLTSLKRLYIQGCNNLTGLLPVKPLADEGLHNLELLKILHCPNLVVFPTSFTFLKKITIRGSSKIEFIPEGLGFHGTLEELRIVGCPSLKSLPASIQCLANLTDLQLSECDSLRTLPEGMQNLTALKSLDISLCPGIKILPKGLQQRLHGLERLNIFYCPALARRCKQGGDYWDKIKDIPYLEIKQ